MRRAAGAPRRPYGAASREEVLARFEAALVAHAGSDGAECIHELWLRGEMGVHVEAMLARLWRVAAGSIPEWLPMRHVDWLPLVYEAAAGFRAAGRGRSNLYLVLLDYADRREGPFGIYVGMSRYPASERFDQHKAGVRAAGSVLKRGLEVLTGPVAHLQRIPRGEAARIESELAERLRSLGMLVRGGH
jgi:hypothetical protein